MNANAPHLTSDTDRTIDRALSALRDAHPRSGLESRILTSLEQRSVTPQPVRPLLSAHFALWCATSAAILAIASMTILHHRSVERSAQAVILSEARSGNSDAVILRERSESKNPEIAGATTNVKSFSTTKPTRITQNLSSRPERVARSGETRISDQQDIASPTDLDAQALADLHAPSHPAPPLPLTPQEKLFLRMLRYGNATQLAELNPLVRAQQDADETAAFKAFFPDPLPLKQPGDDE